MASSGSTQRQREPTRAPPARRRLRVFSLDPTLSRRTGATAVLSMPWEPLKPGPVGSRIEVLDFTADGARIPGVDLDHPYLLATDGLEPDESDPQFHQQMVYTVIASLLETLDNARGRRLVWRNVWRTSPEGPGVRPMPVFPHRSRAANAFYAPGEGLSFGPSSPPTTRRCSSPANGCTAACPTTSSTTRRRTRSCTNCARCPDPHGPGCAGFPRGLRRHPGHPAALHPPRAPGDPDRAGWCTALGTGALRGPCR